MTAELHRITHSAQYVSSVAAHVYELVLSPPVEYLINTSTTVRAILGDWVTPCRETELPLAPDGGGREVGYTSGQLSGRSDSGWSDPWTDQGKQPFWRLFTQYSRDCPLISSPTFHRALQEPQCSMYVHVSTCRGSCIWVTSLQLHIYIRAPLYIASFALLL